MPTSGKKRLAPAALKVISAARPLESAEPKPNDALRPTNAVYAITIFLGAFLLFQVELILGKFVLPRFGGGPSVWSTSLLTFQFLLLAGYTYAAVLTQRFSPKTQRHIHLGMLSASMLAIAAMLFAHHSPILPLSTAAPSASTSPVWQIAFLLMLAAGFPCLLLSASSPLLQQWFSEQNGGRSPYRLYALSNLGSMLALLSYPFIVERFLRLSTQAWLWTSLYVVFVVITAICAMTRQSAFSAPALVTPKKSKTKPLPRPTFIWLALSACGSVMLLATTNLICQEVAVIPLLWVLPLSLYLLSFIVCFDHARWYRREIFIPLYLALTLASLRTLPAFTDMTIRWPLVIFCSTLFAVCMVCHGELARLKPEPKHLTGFYLMISAGGLIGSASVVLVAPHIFSRFWEFQIALLGCGVLLAFLLLRDPSSWVRDHRAGLFVFSAATLALAIGAWVYTDALLKKEGEGDLVVWRARNFFGMKTVVRLDTGLYLLHGRTLHGMQLSNPELRDEPTIYYRRDSGIGLLLGNVPDHLLGVPLRLGAIGMGAGTLAAYGQSGDFIRFYEIDPDVVGLSRGTNPFFTFVKDSPAHVEIATGDARIVLQQELASSGSQNFDVLAVDAFSGDAVPVHLLTREAMSLYLQHLRGPQSVIAFHVTNRSIDLRPVVAALAREFRLASLEVHPPQVGDWILLSADPSRLQLPPLVSSGRPIELARPELLWTDDYSNLYSLLRSW